MISNQQPVIIVTNRGPIIQLHKDNSQRSLYSENQNQSPLQIQSKSRNVQANNQNTQRKIQEQRIQRNISERQQQKQINKQLTNNKRNQRYSNQQTLPNANLTKNTKNDRKLGGFRRSKNNLIMPQNEPQLRHQYRNYKNTNNIMMDLAYQSNKNSYESPRNLLKFNQKPIPKIHHPTVEQFLRDTQNATNSQFNQMNSIDFPKLNSDDLRNRSLRSSQGGRWLRSQSYMQQNQKKASDIHDSLVKNYHKHESKYFNSLQKYLKIFTDFQQKITKSQMGISLMHPLEDIKVKLQLYMEKTVRLQNLPIDKPNAQWTQSQLTKFFTNYKPIYLPFDSINSMNQSLILKKYKNCVYFGHINEGKKSGDGVIYYYSGKIFQGRFQNDQKVQGFQMDEQEDEVYVGKFEKGLKHGTGVLKNNQQLLYGEWRNGEFTNSNAIESKQQAKLKQQIGSKFGLTNESFMNNRVRVDNNKQIIKKQGLKLTFNNLFVYSQEIIIFKSSSSSDIFIGNFKQETLQKEGQGLQIFTNGDLYIGNYQNNAPQGYGEYYWSSGAYYRGEFMSGMRHGKGKWHMLHGDMYEGQYMNDKKNGKGSYLWKNGAKYVGSFQNDYRHGYGEMKWNDGRQYKGEWLNGIQKNVKIKLDKGIDKTIKNPGATISSSLHQSKVLHQQRSFQQQKRTLQTKKHFLPGVTKKTFRSTSNPNTKQSFHRIDSNTPIKKKIAIQNIKALYNPSNY